MNQPHSHPTSALLTDLYQLTMLDAYYQLGMEDTAVFEFFVRRLPYHRNFLVAAGLEQALDFLETLHFEPHELDWLASTELFDRSFLERLAAFRFSGHVMAMDEGTVCFADEPILRITAPLPEAQLVESRIINLLHFQTMIASKAARCRLVAGSAVLVDFGMRRAHGAEAACLAARAGFLAGMDATATVEAGRRYGIPLAGTMAHSFVQAHDVERQAFEHFARCRPRNVVLLIDTYDIERAAHHVVELANRLRPRGVVIRGVRIDSGDLLAHSQRVRHILDAGGARDINILVSGNLDEHSIDALRRQHAPIDTYCVGTKVATSSDAPALDCAYKLNEYAGKPRRKLSPGKATWPGPRQVYRRYDLAGQIDFDAVTCCDESQEGRALLREVMSNGQRCHASPALRAVREYCARELATLPPPYRTLEPNIAEIVKVSAREQELAASMQANL